MRMRFLLALTVMLLLAACAPAPQPAPAAAPTPTPEPRLEWDTRPEAVIFRLDSGGSSSDRASDLSAVPFCTVYGDGHVIWVNPGTTPQEVLEALVDEETLRAFLMDLITLGYYTWEPQHIGLPDGRGAGPLVERAALNLFGEVHGVDSAGNWPPGTFAALYERCRALSDSPALYLPGGAWVSALPTTERANRTYPWASYAAAFDGARLADMPPDRPRWFSGEAAADAWNLARRGRVLLTEGDATYRLIVQVPGLQPGAPAAPR